MANLSVRHLESNQPPLGNPLSSHPVGELVLNGQPLFDDFGVAPQSHYVLFSSLSERSLKRAVFLFGGKETLIFMKPLTRVRVNDQ
jgi:hypothetical protein